MFTRTVNYKFMHQNAAFSIVNEVIIGNLRNFKVLI